MYDKIFRGILYFEAVLINLLVGLICFFVPAWFVSNFSPEPVPPLALEIFRWYGVLLFVFAYVMLRALRSASLPALRFAVEGFLLGDVAHLAATVLYFRAGGVLNLSSAFMLFMASFLAVTRAIWLWTQRHADSVH
jgi:hypothetical protein